MLTTVDVTVVEPTEGQPVELEPEMTTLMVELLYIILSVNEALGVVESTLR